MGPDVRKFLFDVSLSARLIQRFTEGKTFVEYSEDEMLRSAVERQFQVIGEAISQLYRINQDTASRIRDYRRIIAFRNILTHGYAVVDDRVVWNIVMTRLSMLLEDVQRLLQINGDD